MPDPKQMSGIPRPVDDLPNGAVSVRADSRRAVEQHRRITRSSCTSAAKSRTVEDRRERARAVRRRCPPGATREGGGRSSTASGSSRRSSRRRRRAASGCCWSRPTRRKERAAAAASAPAVTGHGRHRRADRASSSSRGEETVERLLPARHRRTTRAAPVNPPTPFVFDMPAGAHGHAASWRARRRRRRVERHARASCRAVSAGQHASCRSARELPASGGASTSTQRFPRRFEQLAVIVKKVGDTTLRVAAARRAAGDAGATARLYIAGAGGAGRRGPAARAARSTGLPHHSPTPRRDRAGARAAASWLAGRLGGATRVRSKTRRAQAAEREAADRAPREAVQDLVRLEQRRDRDGRVDDVAATPRAARRLVARPRARSTARSTADDTGLRSLRRTAPGSAALRRVVTDARSTSTPSSWPTSRATSAAAGRCLSVSLTLGAGDIVGLLGPNGAGQVDADRHARDAGARRRSGEVRYGEQPARGARRRAAAPHRPARPRAAPLSRADGAAESRVLRRGCTASIRAAVVDAALERGGPARSRRRSGRRLLARACGSGSRSSARCCTARGSCCSTSRSPASTIARSALVAERLRRLARRRRDRRARDARSRSGRRPGHARGADPRRPAARRTSRAAGRARAQRYRALDRRP